MPSGCSSGVDLPTVGSCIVPRVSDDELLSIGDFAEHAGLSPKNLRRYADMGLIAPAKVDPRTGYRWFSSDQIGDARLVGLLRRIDMPLERIKDALFSRSAAERWHAVRSFWSEQRQLVAERERVLLELHALLTSSDLPILEWAIIHELSEGAARRLSAVMASVSLPADTPVFRQGDPADALFVVASGSVRVVVGEKTVTTLAGGQVVGELGVLDDRPRSASVFTESPCVLYKLTRADFRSVAAEFPEVSSSLRAVSDQRMGRS